jgi:ribosomal protein L29
MKVNEFSSKNKQELERNFKEIREKLRQLRFDLAAGKVKNVREVRKNKKEVARILTALRQLPEEKINKTKQT